MDWACPLTTVFHRHAWSSVYIPSYSMHKVVLVHRMNLKFPFSFNSYAHMHGCVIYHQIHLHVWALDQALAPTYLLMAEFFPYNYDWELTDLHLLCRCWINFPKSYFGFSRPKPYQFIAWESPSNVICRYGAFLLNSLKVDNIASLHLLAPYHVHYNCHIISINTQVHLSLEKECRYPIPPWVYHW
jgi:hypothetical protein